MTKLLPLIQPKAKQNSATNSYKRRHPPWIKAKMPGGPKYMELKDLMRKKNLHTVCEEAHCPNIGECWELGTATFMILGEICTRACRYCAVTTGKPNELDTFEPIRVAESVKSLIAAISILLHSRSSKIFLSTALPIRPKPLIPSLIDIV